MYKPTAKSYFSGLGGMDIGMMRAGVNVISSLDLDPAAIRVMQNNPQYFGHKILHRDIADVTVLDQDKSDVMIFTYPCTKYSAIADIHGARTGDELFLHALRHVALARPEVYVVENVPGMKKFKVVMEAMTKLPDYYVNVFCPLDAATWVPQRRKRLILVATRKPFSIPAPTPKKKATLKSLLEKDAPIDLPKSAINRLQGVYRDLPIIVDPANKDEVAPTCVAHYAKDRGTRLVKDRRSPYGARPFTIREYARLQGLPDDLKLPDALTAFRLIGNAVEVNMAEWIGSEVVRYFN